MRQHHPQHLPCCYGLIHGTVSDVSARRRLHIVVMSASACPLVHVEAVHVAPMLQAMRHAWHPPCRPSLSPDPWHECCGGTPWHLALLVSHFAPHLPEVLWVASEARLVAMVVVAASAPPWGVSAAACAAGLRSSFCTDGTSRRSHHSGARVSLSFPACVSGDTGSAVTIKQTEPELTVHA